MKNSRLFQGELTLADSLLNMKMSENGVRARLWTQFHPVVKESIRRKYLRNVLSQALPPRREDAGSIIKPPTKSDEVPPW